MRSISSRDSPDEAVHNDALLAPGRLVTRRYADDAIGIDVERYLYLGYTARRGGNVAKLKAAQTFVVGRHLALALKDMDVHRRLPICRRGEGLHRACRNRRVAGDQARRDAAQSLDSQRKRCDIQKNDVLDFAAQNPRLNRRAQSDDLVGISSLVRLFAEKRAHHLLHGGHAGRAADEQHPIDRPRFHFGVGQRLPRRGEHLFAQVFGQRLEL